MSRQKLLEVVIPCRPTTTGLHLLIDSTGIKMLGEGEWKTKKHGAEYRRQWRKVHLGIDAQTLEIRAIEVSRDFESLHAARDSDDGTHAINPSGERGFVR